MKGPSRPTEYSAASLRPMRRDLEPTAQCSFTAPTTPPQHPPKSGTAIQNLEKCDFGQRSSSTLPSQTRRSSKRFMLRSPAHSPAIALGDSTPSRLHSIPIQTPHSPMRIVEKLVHLTDELLSLGSSVCKLPPGLGLYRACLKRRSGSWFSFSPRWHPRWTKMPICAVVQSPRSVKYIPLQWSETLSPHVRLATSCRDSLNFVSSIEIHLFAGEYMILSLISFLLSQLGCTPTLTCFQLPSRACNRSSCTTVPPQ